MKKKFLLLLIIPLLIIFASFFKPQKSSTDQPEILVTIAPYKYFAERLTNHQVVVKNLIPEAADPHGFEPPAKELLSLLNAKAWFLIGEPFEEQFLPILKKNAPDLQAVLLHKHIHDRLCHSCCQSHHTEEDLHFWMSPKIMKEQISFMASQLQEIYPDMAQQIAQNLALINQDFDALSRELQSKVKLSSSDYLLVSHPAFGYFCKDYHLSQLSLENEAQDPSTKEIAELFQTIKDNHIKTIFVQKQHSYKMAQMTAESLDLNMVEFNPYHESYFENMHSFGNQLGDR